MGLKNKVKELMDLGYEKDVIKASLGMTDKAYDAIEKRILLEQRNEQEQPVIKRTKLDWLRERYEQLYTTEYGTPKPEIKELSEEEIEKLTETLNEVKREISRLPSFSALAKITSVNTLLKKLEYLDDKMLPLDIAEKLYRLLPSNRTLKIEDTTCVRKLERKRSFYHNKYAETINHIIERESDPKKLEELLERIKLFLAKSKELTASSFEAKIKHRLAEQKKKVFDVDTPTEVVREMAKSLFAEEYDAEKMQELIDQEAQDFYERRKQFVEETAPNETMKRLQMPSIEGSRRQIVKQISDWIRNNGKDMTDIVRTYHRLLQIHPNQSVVLGAIVDGLIASERYDDANEFLVEGLIEKLNADTSRLIRQNRLRVRNAEIASFIMRGIRALPGQIEDENKYYDTIVSGIEQAGIAPDAILLGKSKDRLKTITWKDLTQRTKGKER